MCIVDKSHVHVMIELSISKAKISVMFRQKPLLSLKIEQD
jgi:hypothetical protein